MKVWGTATGKDLLTLRHGENGAGEEKALQLHLHFGRRAHLRQRLHGRALGPQHCGKDVDVKTCLSTRMLDPLLPNIAQHVLRPVKTEKNAPPSPGPVRGCCGIAPLFRAF